MPDAPKEPRGCFVDTNIWLYALVESDDPRRRIVAQEIVRRDAVVASVQVINETCVNLLKKALLQEEDIRRLIAAFYVRCIVSDVNQETLLAASSLREKYSLSFWDSVIVASALYMDCEILYTEDMQDGLEIEERLTIVNPFTHP